MQWLSDMQFDNIDFETNSKITCDAFHSIRDDIFEFGCIICFCHSSFTNFKVEFARWQANADAHVFAQKATFLVSPVVYLNIPVVLNLLLLMKCYKHVSLLKKCVFIFIN